FGLDAIRRVKTLPQKAKEIGDETLDAPWLAAPSMRSWSDLVTAAKALRTACAPRSALTSMRSMLAVMRHQRLARKQSSTVSLTYLWV
ncbi:MAG: hypothetical protein DI537_46190, partial [Stutzerimonas stutzeri]